MCWTSTGEGGTYQWPGHSCNIPGCTGCCNADFIFSGTGWWTVAETTFEWAIAQVKSGIKVRRKKWNTNVHIYKTEVFEFGADKPALQAIRIDEGSVGGDYVPTQEAMLATDWEVYVKTCGECGHPKS